MNEKHKNLLRTNRCQLAKELDTEQTFQYLIEHNKILNDHIVEKINAEKTTYSRNVAFLNKLTTRGPEAFDTFISGLLETDQDHLAELLVPGILQNRDVTNGSIDEIQLPTSRSAPSFFNFTSTPEKNPYSLPSVSITPVSSLHSIGSDNINMCDFTQQANSNKRAMKRPILTEKNSFTTAQASPMKANGATDELSHFPVEHMEASTCSNEDSPLHTPKRKCSFSSEMEILRCRKPLSSLYCDAGIISNVQEQQSSKTNNHTLSPAKINLNQNTHTAQSFADQSLPFVTDSPTTDSVTLKKSTPDFIRDHAIAQECYPMYKRCKGLALIISVVNFDSDSCLDDRHGGGRDCARMELLLRQLSYEVYHLTNGNASEIWNTLKNFAAWNKHAQCESTFVVLMSHGEEGVIYGRDGKTINLSQVYDLFSNAKCQHLQNKPKIFIVQACRGDEPDKGTDQMDGPIRENRLSKNTVRHVASSVGDTIKNRLPTISDMFIAYATVPGFAAMRNTERGSWFIQALIQVLAFHARDKSLLDIMTITNNMIKGREGWSPESEFHRCKEMSVFHSCLCKPFYFFPGMYLDGIN